jgi:CRISPR/Cas system-associated endoribonuclease Cas2
MEGIKRGDITRIAELTGFSYDMVKKVIKGDRRNIAILNAAKKLIQGRREIGRTSPRRKNHA